MKTPPEGLPPPSCMSYVKERPTTRMHAHTNRHRHTPRRRDRDKEEACTKLVPSVLNQPAQRHKRNAGTFL